MALLTGRDWWGKMGDKMNQEPEECPEWAQLVCGTWVKPKHWEWSRSEWAFRCMMCGKVAKNSGHVEGEAHVKNLRNWRYKGHDQRATRITTNMSFDYENPWQFTAADLPDQDDRTALAVWAGADADEGQRARATPSPRAAPGLEPPWNQLIDDVRGLGEDVRVLRGLREDVLGLREDVHGLGEEVRGVGEDVRGLRGLRDQLIDDVRGLREDVRGLRGLRDQLNDDVRGLRGDVEELKQLVQGTRNVAPYWHQS